MRAVITVVGKDKIGIIASVTTMLTEKDINILDISQTILQDFFTMVMIVDTSKSTMKFEEIREALKYQGQKLDLSIRIQHEDIFNSMHTI